MALIEVFHVVASNLIIDASDTTDIPQGAVVTLDDDYLVTLANNSTTIDPTGAQSVQVHYPVGLAGDSRSQGTTSYTPESGSSLSRDPKSTLEGSLVTGAYGVAQRYTQNRVADNYNEVLASGKMTVYHSGGEFWTDQYQLYDEVTTCEYYPAGSLYVSSSSEAVGTGEYHSFAGQFTDVYHAGYLSGLTLTSPTSYPSGVPGTETGFLSLPEGGNSMTFGTFLHVKLLL